VVRVSGPYQQLISLPQPKRNKGTDLDGDFIHVAFLAFLDYHETAAEYNIQVE
jgi:hypothetical protein